MSESLFSRLFRYSETEKHISPRENYLTELLAWLIENLSTFGTDYLSLLCDHSNPDNSETISELRSKITDINEIHSYTQVNVKKGIIDMIITTDNGIGFVCEHKVDSVLDKNQICKYKKCEEAIKNDFEVDEVKYVFLSKCQDKREKEQHPDIIVRWNDVFNYFNDKMKKEDYENNTLEATIIQQFLDYLTEEGMGMKDSLNINGIMYYKEAMELQKRLKSMFSDIASEFESEKSGKNNGDGLDVEGLKKFLGNDFSVIVPKKRWGRIGIEMFKEKWEPGIFTGVIIDNADHKVVNGNDKIQFVVLIDINYDNPDYISDFQRSIWKKIDSIQLDNHGDKGYCQYTDFYIEKKPKNKWRGLILEKPLEEVIGEDTDYKKQKERIKSEIIKGIKFILDNCADK